MYRFSWLLMLTGLGLVSGCESQSPTSAPANAPAEAKLPTAETTSPEPNDQTAEPAAAASAEGAEIVVTPIDVDGLQAAVEKHAGKVVLLDCWATWCVPCLAAFPHTVEMSRKYADDGLVVMSLSFDDPADGETLEQVKKFLKAKDAPFEHYISKLDIQDEGATAFNIDDGALPHYKLFDRSGKLLKTLNSADPDQPLTPEDLEAAVVEALK